LLFFTQPQDVYPPFRFSTLCALCSRRASFLDIIFFHVCSLASCVGWFLLVAHQSPFIFSQPLTMLVQCPQLLLGDDWFYFPRCHGSVSVCLERIHFPVRSMLPAVSSSPEVDSKCPMQLCFSLCDLILLYSGSYHSPVQVSPLSSSSARGYLVTLPLCTPLHTHAGTMYVIPLPTSCWPVIVHDILTSPTLCVIWVKLSCRLILILIRFYFICSFKKCNSPQLN